MGEASRIAPGATAAVATVRPGTDPRYLSLDGLRGIAALAVALFHHDRSLVPGGYLAVDFFFVLSGFVLARTYGPRLRHGLAWRRFMLMRLIRLYPLYATGIALSVAYTVQAMLRGTETALNPAEWLLALAFNAAMLPAPFSDALFPINFPAWSLFFELLANAALVLVLARLGAVALAAGAAVAGVALVLAVHGFQATPAGAALLAEGLSPAGAGVTWDGWLVATLRTTFSFTVGVLIGQRAAVGRRAGPWTGACFLVLALLMWAPVAIEHRVGFDLLVILIGSPLLVLAGAGNQPQRYLASFAALIGEVSYAIYAIHVPVSLVFQFVARSTGLSNAALAPAYLVGCVAVAWICVRVIDLPARRALAARLLR